VWLRTHIDEWRARNKKTSPENLETLCSLRVCVTLVCVTLPSSSTTVRTRMLCPGLWELGEYAGERILRDDDSHNKLDYVAK
jgi:hypothetical protein